ncbi:MAG: VOC family protein [Planctomycetes bacterium]|nr:VOC family protein [Planctomycetota bacterium]
MKEVFGGARTIVLSVRNLAKSRAFWVDRLGFRAMKEEPDRFVQLNLGNFRLRLESADDVRRPRGTGTGTGTAIVFQVRSLPKTAKELEDRGVAFEELDLPRDGASLVTGDPDGHRVIFRERV